MFLQLPLFIYCLSLYGRYGRFVNKFLDRCCCILTVFKIFFTAFIFYLILFNKQGYVPIYEEGKCCPECELTQCVVENQNGKFDLYSVSIMK